MPRSAEEQPQPNKACFRFKYRKKNLFEDAFIGAKRGSGRAKIVALELNEARGTLYLLMQAILLNGMF